MLEEEDQDWFIPSRDLNNQGVGQLQQQLNGLSVSDHHNNLEEVAVSQMRLIALRSLCRFLIKWVILFCFLLSAEEEHLESWSKGVCPGEEILGVPLTPMEPQHARTHMHKHTQTHAPVLSYSQRLWRPRPHTRWSSHASMHTHTLEVSGVLPGPIGGWGVFFSFFFLQSFYFLFVSCKLRDIGDGWERGCSTSSALLWALAHHCISHHAVDVYRACRSQQVPWKIGSYLGVMPRQSLNSKSLVFFCFSVNLCLIGWKTKHTFPAGWRLLCCWGQKDEHFRGLQRASAVAL